MSFKYVPFSKKQLKLLTWWTSKSPWKNASGIIAEGSVRAGKTLLMSLSFVFWSMQRGSGEQYALCGKTIGSLKRNVITPLLECIRLRGWVVRRRDESFVVFDGNHTNTYFLFGGRDERSQDLIQGITLAGVLFDEVALMPRSFVNQALARCSVDGSKFWFNCNPEGPMHWFYQEHVLKAEEKHYVRLHFNLEDNPSLSEEIIKRYKSMFSGVFYRRFILGEWVAASGVIYDCFNPQDNMVEYDQLPWQIKEKNIKPWYSTDYGTFNPQVYLEGYYINSTLFITKEYYYDGRQALVQKTVDEYVADFAAFREERYKANIVDPSASALIVSMEKSGEKVYKAKNDVIHGINKTYNLMAEGRIKILPCCKNLIQELGTYSWDEKKSDRTGEDAVVKAFDHCCDALRYMVMTVVPDFQAFKNNKE